MHTKKVIFHNFLLLVFVATFTHIAYGENNMAESKKIEVFDKEGKQYLIDEEEWRSKVLPKNIKDNWGDAEGLYYFIHMAFQDGFGADVLEAAKHLKEIKPDERSYSTLGVLLIQQKQLQQAEETFNEQIQKFGRSSFALNYLAKIYADTGREKEIEGLLYEALTLNPNENNALEWWAGLHYDQGGDAARTKALKQIADFPGSWRPQLWLGRQELENNHTDEAIQLFKQVLNNAPTELDALLTISGDLGKKGMPEKSVELVAPLYKPSDRNVFVGLNLLESYRQMQNHVQGLKLLDEMKQLERYDLMERFESYSEQFNKMKHSD